MYEQTQEYWNDVSRHYGDIISGLPLNRDGNFGYTAENRFYDWPAEEIGVRAYAIETTHSFLGGIATHTENFVALRRPLGRTGRLLDHLIIFDADKQEIARVQDQLVTPGHTNDLSERIAYLRALRQLRKPGLTHPTPDDYELLGLELKRGADFRSFDVS